ncbi:MAG: hypothetical protein R8G34_18945 [Paracoccaceae bacterium]|nr:hypothetical protein [Paracoccaceae bacterium]
MALHATTLPDDRYWDDIDQMPYLLTDQGESKREQVHFSLGSTLAAVRM